MEVLFTLDTINSAAEEVWEQIKDRKVFAFRGQMGAGKTTFIHALCDALKVTNTVSSPTFSIINQYKYPQGVVYHLDLYRLQDEEEAIRAGVEDVLYSGNVCFVEWPERAPQLFPDETVFIEIEAVNPEVRRIKIDRN